jgi:hypothetical protein
MVMREMKKRIEYDIDNCDECPLFDKGKCTDSDNRETSANGIPNWCQLNDTPAEDIAFENFVMQSIKDGKLKLDKVK